MVLGDNKSLVSCLAYSIDSILEESQLAYETFTGQHLLGSCADVGWRGDDPGSGISQGSNLKLRSGAFSGDYGASMSHALARRG